VSAMAEREEEEEKATGALENCCLTKRNYQEN
jgi:hypothetical protein